MVTHTYCHGLLVFSVTRVNVEHRNTPSIFFDWIQAHAIVLARQAFALGFHGKIIGNLSAHTLAPTIPKLWNQEGVLVEFLAAVAIETIAPQKSFINVLAFPGVNIFGDEEPARPANGFSLRR